MKILQLTNKVPWPEKDGGSLGVSVFTKALLEAGQQVKMLAMNTSRHLADTDYIPQKLKDHIALETVYVDTSIKPLNALAALVKGESYNISRFFSTEFNDKISALLKNEHFDVIQFEGLYLTPYIKTIRVYSSAPIVLREHNIEWMIWKRLADEEKSILKRIYLNILARQLKDYEEVMVNLCDGITTTTLNDKQRLQNSGCKTSIAHIPFGVDIRQYKPAGANGNMSLFFIGALDWLPNLQGLDWFLQQVWPKVHRAYPQLVFHVAGRNMPEKYQTGARPGIVFHGETENALDFIGSYGIMIVPLLAGSGIRVKIIEGMAMQKPVITTSLGLEGIECKNKADVLIADTPDEFYDAIKMFMENTALREKIGLNARKYIETTHNITNITANLISFYTELISKKAAVH